MRKSLIVICLIIVLTAFLFTGCSKDKTNIKVGSKDFTESYILAELYALVLEGNGIPVERKFNLGGTNVAHQAMLKGDLDLYPEYTGTCLINVLHQEPMKDPKTVYDYVAKEYSEQFSLTLLNPAKASNSQGLAISKLMSERFGITTISQLRDHSSEIRFASQGAFEENPDGMRALISTYGDFNFKSINFFDNAIKYELIKNNKVDLVIAFTTDGQLTDPSVVLLEDDKQAWPPYNIVPIVRNEILINNPKIPELLNSVSSLLDNITMQMLNAEVDIKKREPEDVAKEFFEENLK
jgi:osmoprotectant transport system substrate-binding protein